MQSNCIIFILTYISAVNPFKFEKIENITGTVKFIEFGPDSNIYIGSKYESSQTIYKLNADKKIIAKDESLTGIQKLIVTSSNNAYVFDSGTSSGPNGGSIYFIGHNASHVEKVYEFPLNEGQSHVYFMDEREKIYFNTAYGVAALQTSLHEKRGLTTPKSINNLEDFSIGSDSSYAMDKFGRIYFGGIIQTDKVPKLALIQAHELYKLVPSAELVNMPNSKLSSISTVSTDGRKRNTIIAFNGDYARIYRFTQFGQLELIFGEYAQNFGKFFTTKHRFYFFARNTFMKDCYLNYGYYWEDDSGYPSYTFSSISNMNFMDYDCEQAIFSSDSGENIFFAVGKKKVFTLKKNEMYVKKINFPEGEPEYEVTALVVDESDSLWILAGDLFKVEKDTLKAEQITNSTIAAESGFMKIHPETKELFIGSENGLHIYSD